MGLAQAFAACGSQYCFEPTGGRGIRAHPHGEGRTWLLTFPCAAPGLLLGPLPEERSPAWAWVGPPFGVLTPFSGVCYASLTPALQGDRVTHGIECMGCVASGEPPPLHASVSLSVELGLILPELCGSASEHSTLVSWSYCSHSSRLFRSSSQAALRALVSSPLDR